MARSLREESADVLPQQGPSCAPTILANIMRQLEGGLKRFGFADIDSKDPQAVAEVLNSLYDSVYNSKQEVKARGGRRINVEETSGVHFLALGEMAEKHGLSVEIHDADFEPKSIRYKTREADQKYIDQRLHEIGTLTIEEKAGRIGRLMDSLVKAINDGHMAAIRGRIGNHPQYTHWWLATGWDPEYPGKKIILLNPWGGEYTRSVRPSDIKTTLPGQDQMPGKRIEAWRSALRKKLRALQSMKVREYAPLKKEIDAIQDHLMPHLISIMVLKSR